MENAGEEHAVWLREGESLGVLERHVDGYANLKEILPELVRGLLNERFVLPEAGRVDHLVEGQLQRADEENERGHPLLAVDKLTPTLNRALDLLFHRHHAAQKMLSGHVRATRFKALCHIAQEVEDFRLVPGVTTLIAWGREHVVAKRLPEGNMNRVDAHESCPSDRRQTRLARTDFPHD